MANRNYKQIERIIKSFSRNVEAEGEGDAKLEDDKIVSPSTETIHVRPDEGYDGLKQVIVEAVPLMSGSATPSTTSQTITPDEGALGFDSFTVEAVDPSQYYKPETSANVNPSTVSQTITPSENEVFNVVNVSAVTSAIDQNIKASNIVSGVSILGVNGTYSVPLQSKSVDLTTSSATFTPDNGYSGFSQITVSAKLMSSTVTPANTTQTVTPASGYVGFSRVRVNAVSATTSTIYPSKAEWSGQQDTIYPPSGYYFSRVYVSRVDSSIDSNIQPSNIKKDVNILGVTGTLEGGGVIEVDTLPESGNIDSIYRLTEAFALEEVSANLPEGLFNFTAVGIHYSSTPVMGTPPLRKVFIFGGEYANGTGSDKIYIYDVETKTLTQSTYTLPFALAEACGTYYDYSGSNGIYLFGGKRYANGNWESNSYPIRINISVYSDFAIESVSSQTYINYDFCGGLAISYSGYIYLVGGRKSNGGSITISANVFKYSPSMGDITETVSIDHVCDFKIVGQIDYSAYLLAGGSIDHSGNPVPTNDIYRLNLSPSVSWSNLTSPDGETLKPCALSNIGGVALPYDSQQLSETVTKGYALGGINSNGDKTNTICRFTWNYRDVDVETSVIGTLPEAISDMQCVDTLIFGGLTENGISNKIYKVNTNERKTDYVYRDGQWYNLSELGIIEVEQLPQTGRNDRIYDTVETNFEVSATKLPVSLCGSSCVAVGNYIYIIGGSHLEGTSSYVSRKIYKYDTTTNTFTELPDTVGMVSSERFYSVKIENKIYIFSQYEEYRVLDTTTDTLSATNNYPLNPRGIVAKENLIYVLRDDRIYEFLVDVEHNSISPTNRSARLYNSAGVFGTSIVIKDDIIYLIPVGTSYGYPSNNFYIVDINKDISDMPSTIYPLEDVPYSLAYGNTIVYGNDIYVFGGQVSTYHSSSDFTNKILKYNIPSGTFEELTDTLPNASAAGFGAVVGNTVYIFGGYNFSDSQMVELALDDISTLSTTVLSEYVYRNNSWIEIGGNSGGIQVDKVTNLSASGTIISWTAPDTTEISQYNPQLAYAVSVDGNTVATTSQTSIDLSEYLASGSHTVAVNVVLTYTDTKNETITIAGKAEIVEANLNVFDSMTSNDIYKENGILGKVSEVSDPGYSFQMYTIFGGNSAGMVNSSAFYVTQERCSGMPSTDETFITQTRITQNFIFSPTSIWRYSIINYSMGGYAVQLSSTQMTYPTLGGRILTPIINMHVSETYNANIYAFGGMTDYSLTSSVYRLSGAYGNPTYDALPIFMPETRFMGDALYSKIETSSGTTKADVYIIGGFSSLGSTPEDMERATRILKFDVLNESFYTNFSNVMPSNIQTPVGYEVDGRMNSHIAYVQGKPYVLGKDTNDNLMKLFEFDYTEENLKSSGAILVNQNVKAIDTFHTNNYTNYGVAIYQDSLSGKLIFEKIIANKMTKSILNNDLFSFASSYEHILQSGFTSIQNGHLYILGMESSGISPTAYGIDVTLSTGLATSFTISGLSSISKGSMMVDVGNYSYLINGGDIIRIDFANRSIYPAGTIGTPYPMFGTAVAYDEKIYIFGGVYYTGTSYDASSDVYVFDTNTGLTTKLSATLNTARFDAPVVISGHYAYIIDGFGSSSSSYVEYSIEKFDFDTNTFDISYSGSSYLKFANGSNNVQWGTQSYMNSVFTIDNKIYVKSYGEEAEFLYFDSTYENFGPMDVSDMEFNEFTNKNSILLEENFVMPYIGNSGTDLYVVSSVWDESTSTSRYILYKYTK